MNNEQLFFNNKLEFTQAAFNRVAEIVSQQGQVALENFVPALNTQYCLEHLAFVASEYSYDYSFIDAHLKNYKAANADLSEFGGEA
ncbi:hypothetical protein F994_02501 [Acinetobacter bohemicus ANC 3994]|mgnify:FL=1|uniref:Uncharacterized protein n=1 Tax=Acinetobacter bohemicus ANC 3994 TaxID=1217715 RepID=N8NZ36_9GAMM|nr:hypothetical protein [Acinetobacter bohemicus]ENU19641.1 hypothetical protein F994_02501 [Acinetobacter bohemicus ANC 3994]